MELILFPLSALTLGLFIAGLWQVNKAGNKRITYIMRSGLGAVLLYYILYALEGNILGDDSSHLVTQSFLKALVLLHAIGYLLLVWDFFLLCKDYRQTKEGSIQAR